MVLSREGHHIGGLSLRQLQLVTALYTAVRRLQEFLCPRFIPHWIEIAWPNLHYRTVRGGVLLSPSSPRVPPSQLRHVE